MAYPTAREYALLLFLRVSVPALLDLVLGLLLVCVTLLAAAGLARFSFLGVAVVAVHDQSAAIVLGALYVFGVWSWPFGETFSTTTWLSTAHPFLPTRYLRPPRTAPLFCDLAKPDRPTEMNT